MLWGVEGRMEKNIFFSELYLSKMFQLLIILQEEG